MMPELLAPILGGTFGDQNLPGVGKTTVGATYRKVFVVSLSWIWPVCAPHDRTSGNRLVKFGVSNSKKPAPSGDGDTRAKPCLPAFPYFSLNDGHRMYFMAKHDRPNITTVDESAEDWARRSQPKGPPLFVPLLFALGFLIVGFWLWGDMDARGHISHDKLTAVSTENWAIGEYKDCFSLNIDIDQPVLSCDNVLGGDKDKVFKVRFYGRTYIDGIRKNTALKWKCVKNEETDPSITCGKR